MRAVILSVVSILFVGCTASRGQAMHAEPEPLPAYLNYGDCRQLIERGAQVACASQGSSDGDWRQQVARARRAVQQFDPQCAGHADLAPTRARVIACANALEFQQPRDTVVASAKH